MAGLSRPSSLGWPHVSEFPGDLRSAVPAGSETRAERAVSAGSETRANCALVHRQEVHQARQDQRAGGHQRLDAIDSREWRDPEGEPVAAGGNRERLLRGHAAVLARQRIQQRQLAAAVDVQQVQVAGPRRRTRDGKRLARPIVGAVNRSSVTSNPKDDFRLAINATSSNGLRIAGSLPVRTAGLGSPEPLVGWLS